MKLQTKNFKFVAKLNGYENHTDANGVIRWNSNNSVPPRDILELAYLDGKISEQTLTISLATKSEEGIFIIEIVEKTISSRAII